MNYSHVINGLPVKTGDLICTVDGGPPFSPGISGGWWEKSYRVTWTILLYTSVPRASAWRRGPKGA